MDAETKAFDDAMFLTKTIDLPGNVDAGAPKRFATHRLDDLVVPISLGRRIRESLRNMGMTVEWQELERCI